MSSENQQPRGLKHGVSRVLTKIQDHYSAVMNGICSDSNLSGILARKRVVFLLNEGPIISKRDRDEHFISNGQLERLYQLTSGEWKRFKAIKFEWISDTTDFQVADDILYVVLGPRFHGDYVDHKAAMLRRARELYNAVPLKYTSDKSVA